MTSILNIPDSRTNAISRVITNAGISSVSSSVSSSASSSASSSPYCIPVVEANSSDSGSDKSLSHSQQQNIVISTPNIQEHSLNVENEIQLNEYLDSFEGKRVPVRFSSYYSRNDDIDCDYTPEYITNREQHYMESNSPVSMSPNGSDNDDDHNEFHSSSTTKTKKGFKRLTYADVEKTIEKYYNPNQKFSNEFDILVTYLKGQKNLYIQSKNITQTKLNLLVFPSIILTAFITVFSPTVDMGETSIFIISSVNAVIAILVGFTNYLKLESRTESYAQLANQYDKLETMIELSSNKLFFISKETDQTELILNKIKYIENKLNDIKESTVVLIPEVVKKIFPVISHINIFSFIKKIETYKKKLIMQFKDVKNEIGYIIYKWNQRGINIFDDDCKNLDAHTKTQFVKEQTRLMYLMQLKEKIKYELICYKNSYGQIDELFIREIKNAESYMVWIDILLFGSYKKPIIQEPNPVIQEFLKIIFLEV